MIDYQPLTNLQRAVHVTCTAQFNLAMLIFSLGIRVNFRLVRSFELSGPCLFLFFMLNKFVVLSFVFILFFVIILSLVILGFLIILSEVIIVHIMNFYFETTFE